MKEKPKADTSAKKEVKKPNRGKVKSFLAVRNFEEGSEVEVNASVKDAIYGLTLLLAEISKDTKLPVSVILAILQKTTAVVQKPEPNAMIEFLKMLMR